MTGRRVLIVDDDQFVRAALKDILAPLSLEIDEAVDGVEAVERYQAGKFDLVLLDLFMPRKSGIEALMDLRRVDPQARVLVVSSLASEVLVDQALSAGAQGYVLKPFHPLEITEAVKRQLAAGE